MSIILTRNVNVQSGRATVNGVPIDVPNVTFSGPFNESGANGIVLQAHDNLLSRKVAVKIWIPAKQDSRNRRAQALAEASKLAQLNHKNIGQIYSAGELPSGLIYAVMEYLEGVTLKDFLIAKPYDFGERRQLWKELEEALEYAYGKQIYHGDLHDRNIIMVEKGPRLFDFGTSIFAPNVMDSRLRDSKMIWKLVRQIFPEETPEPKEVVDAKITLKIASLIPEVILLIVSAWLDFIICWREITLHASDAHSGKMWEFDMNSLAFYLCETPIFNLGEIERLLTGLNIPSIAISWFKQFTYVYTKSLDYEEIGIGRKGAERFSGLPKEDNTEYEFTKSRWIGWAKERSKIQNP